MKGGWITLAAAAVALTACSTEGRVEDRLEEALVARLGPAEEYDVDVSGLRARSGEAERVRAEGIRVRPARGPVVDRLTIEVRNVRYDRALKRLVAAESVQATAWVRPNDLEVYLEQGGGLRSASVSLMHPDRMRLRFRPELGLPVPLNVVAEVEGTVEGRGSELHFVVREARAGGIGVNGGVTEGLSRWINPVVDLSNLPLDLEVTSVRVEGDALRVDATGDVTAFQESR